MDNTPKKTKAPAGPVRVGPRMGPEYFELELFVSGITPKSVRAIEVLKGICQEHVPGRYSLKIIDIYREPQTAKQNQVFAVPTLIRRERRSRKVFIGDLADADPLLKELGIARGKTDEP